MCIWGDWELSTESLTPLVLEAVWGCLILVLGTEPGSYRKSVLVFLFFCDKTLAKGKLGQRRFILLLIYSPSLKETKAKEDPGGRNSRKTSNAAYLVCFPGLLRYFINSGETHLYLGITLFTLVWVLQNL